MKPGQIVRVTARNSSFYGWCGTVEVIMPGGFAISLISRPGMMWFKSDEVGILN